MGAASITTILPLPDGRIIIGGSFTNIGGTGVSLVARLNEDGTLDRTFQSPYPVGAGSSILESQSALNKRPPFLALQPDGKLIVSYFGLLRLNADGSEDPTFSPSGEGGPIALQHDGKLLVGCCPMRRLNPDGTPDLSFTPPPNVTVGYGIWQQRNGKVIVSGAHYLPEIAVSVAATRRLNVDGTLDSTFQLSGFDFGSTSVTVGSTFLEQPDGRFFLGFFSLARFEEDGLLDPSFGTPSGFADILTEISSVTSQVDGKVIVSGRFFEIAGKARPGLVRLNSDGTVDDSFDPGARFAGSLISVLAMDRNGNLLAGGQFNRQDAALGNGLLRIFASDVEFFPPRITTQPVSKTLKSGSALKLFVRGSGYPTPAVQWQKNGLNIPGATNHMITIGSTVASDSGIYTVALSNSVGIARSSEALVKVTSFPAGSLDPVFKQQAEVSFPVLAVQPNGKILLCAGFVPVGNRFASPLKRIEVDGEADPSFFMNPDPLLRLGAVIANVLVQPDGKILLQVRRDGNQAGSELARLNADGSPDTRFRTNFVAGWIEDMVLQRSGGILIGGRFQRVNGIRKPFLARFEPDGALDQAFGLDVPEFDSGEVTALAVDDDDSILFALTSVRYEPPRNLAFERFARLRPNGAMDTRFYTVLQPRAIRVIAPDPSSDRILVGSEVRVGSQTDIGDPDQVLVRINGDGSIDNTFSSPQIVRTAFDYRAGSVSAIHFMKDGKIIVAGWMDTLNGVPVRNPIRLNSDGTLDPEFSLAIPGFSSTMAIDSLDRILILGQFPKTQGTETRLVRLLGAAGPPAPRLNARTGSDSFFSFTFQSFANASYLVETKDLLTAAWREHTSIAGDNTVKEFREVEAGVQRRFYRLRAE